jgi:hypothetical protein
MPPSGVGQIGYFPLPPFAPSPASWDAGLGAWGLPREPLYATALPPIATRFLAER